MMRTFKLLRHRDVSGVSGVGEVATGTEWDDGTVAIRWHGETPSTVVWNSIHDAMRVHSHGGATELVWDRPEQSPSPAETPMQRVADLMASGLPYSHVAKDRDPRQVEILVHTEGEWRQWLSALGPHNAADASVYADRKSVDYPQQREWTTSDGGVKVYYLIAADRSAS